MATPMRKEIQEGVTLRGTKKKMATPVREEIEKGVELRETKKKMATPMRKEIQEGVTLRKTRQVMDQALQVEIRNGITLKKTKKCEIQAGITQSQATLDDNPAQTMKTAAGNDATLVKEREMTIQQRILKTPLRKEIAKRYKLRATKRHMITPLRKQIQSKPNLRATHRKSDSAIRKPAHRKPTYAEVLKRHMPGRRLSSRSASKTGQLHKCDVSSIMLLSSIYFIYCLSRFQQM